MVSQNVLHRPLLCVAVKYLTYEIIGNEFVICSFLTHDSLLLSINAFMLSGVYQSTIPPVPALLN